MVSPFLLWPSPTQGVSVRLLCLLFPSFDQLDLFAGVKQRGWRTFEIDADVLVNAARKDAAGGLDEVASPRVAAARVTGQRRFRQTALHCLSVGRRRHDSSTVVSHCQWFSSFLSRLTWFGARRTRRRRRRKTDAAISGRRR